MTDNHETSKVLSTIICSCFDSYGIPDGQIDNPCKCVQISTHTNGRFLFKKPPEILPSSRPFEAAEAAFFPDLPTASQRPRRPPRPPLSPPPALLLKKRFLLLSVAGGRSFPVWKRKEAWRPRKSRLLALEEKKKFSPVSCRVLADSESLGGRSLRCNFNGEKKKNRKRKCNS